MEELSPSKVPYILKQLFLKFIRAMPWVFVILFYLRCELLKENKNTQIKSWLWKQVHWWKQKGYVCNWHNDYVDDFCRYISWYMLGFVVYTLSTFKNAQFTFCYNIIHTPFKYFFWYLLYLCFNFTSESVIKKIKFIIYYVLIAT